MVHGGTIKKELIHTSKDQMICRKTIAINLNFLRKIKFFAVRNLCLQYVHMHLTQGAETQFLTRM